MYFSRAGVLALVGFVLILIVLIVQAFSNEPIDYQAPKFLSLGWQAWATLAIFLVAFTALIKEYPPDITLFITASLLVIVGILPPEQFLEGFANEITLTIAMLFIIIKTMEINGLLELIATRFLSKSKNYYVQMLSLIIPVSVVSFFVYHTPLVLLMTPVIRKWALDNHLYPSKFLIPLSFSAILGGACALTGTSTNIIIQGLLGLHSPPVKLGFFEMGLVGGPCAVVGLLYILFVGKYLLPEHKVPSTDEQNNVREEEIKYPLKPWSAALVVSAFLLMIIGNTMGFSLMILSMAAALLVLLTRCISVEQAKTSINGSLLIMIACSFALGRAVETTGIANYLAHMIYYVVGTNPFMLIGGIMLVTIIATEFMSHTAAPLVFFPIAIHVAQLAGYENLEAIKAIGIAIALGTSYCFMLPTGYQINMIIYGPGRYKFLDFIKFGLPLDIILWLLATLLIPLIWRF